MPTYAFKCSKGHEYEEVLTVSDRDSKTKCPKCKRCGKRIFALSQNEPTFTDKLYSSGNGYYDLGLGQVFTSEKQKQNYMKENGFINKGHDRPMTKKQERMMYSYRMSNKPQF